MLVKDIAKMIIKSINPGKADISGIGDGTIKGGMVFLKRLIDKKVEKTDVVDPMLATKAGFAADALATKNQLNELNKNIGIFQNIECSSEGNIQPGSWYKVPNLAIDLSAGVYVMSFWIRSQGGGSMSQNYNTPFSISVGLSESTSYNDDAVTGCLNKNWSVTSCSKFLKLDSPKKYNLFLKHDAKEAHKIDVRINIVKIR